MDYAKLFNSLYPGFFQGKMISAMPQDRIFTELVLDLHGKLPDAAPFPCPDGITFGTYGGALSALRDAVSRVDADWVTYFGEGGRYYCAFDGERIAAFCILSDMGRAEGLHIGGPGCVGTVPEYRRQGIGLEMVRLATETLRDDGFDLSWIHHTHLAHWYKRLGYQPVLQWNSGGILQSRDGKS